MAQNRYLIVLIFLSLLLLFLVPVSIFVNSAQNFSEDTVSNLTTLSNQTLSPCESAIDQKVTSINQTMAITTAQQSQAYQQFLAPGVQSNFLSVGADVKYTSTCQLAITDVIVGFELYNSSSLLSTISVVENPSLSSVQNIVRANASSQFGQDTYICYNLGSGCWTGYQFWNCVSGCYHQVTLIDATYNEVAISFPPSPSNCGNNEECWLGEWVGLGTTPSASDGNLAQAGSGSHEGIVCGRGCIRYADYNEFYEILPNGPVYGNFSPSTGDSMEAKVTYDGNNLFSFNVWDHSKSQDYAQTNIKYSRISSPTYGYIITENPEECTYLNGCDPLAEFSPTITYSGQITLSGGCTCGIWYPYSEGWYDQTIMQYYSNSCTSGSLNDNINVGSLNTQTSSFTTQWLSSECSSP